MIVKGHGLLREGDAHDESGSYMGGSSAGYGFCSCGVRSALLESTAARKRWHRAHKSVVVRARDKAFAEDHRIISERTAIILITLYVLALAIYKVATS